MELHIICITLLQNERFLSTAIGLSTVRTTFLIATYSCYYNIYYDVYPTGTLRFRTGLFSIRRENYFSNKIRNIIRTTLK